MPAGEAGSPQWPGAPGIWPDLQTEPLTAGFGGGIVFGREGQSQYEIDFLFTFLATHKYCVGHCSLKTQV